MRNDISTLRHYSQLKVVIINAITPEVKVTLTAVLVRLKIPNSLMDVRINRVIGLG
jgi:hypothetical protein